MSAGAFGENFPYTNFHDLNLDWLIKAGKEIIESKDVAVEAKEAIEEAKEATIEAKNTAVESKNIAVEAKNTAVDAKNTAVQARNGIEAITNQALQDQQNIQTLLNSLPSDFTDLNDKVNTISETTYNLFPYETTGQFVTQKEYNLNVPAGTYTLYAITETTNQARDRMNVVFVHADNSIEAFNLRKNQLTSTQFTLQQDAVKIRFQAADGYSYSEGYTARYSNIMLYSGFDYKEYIPHLIAVDNKSRLELEHKQDELYTFEPEYTASYGIGAIDHQGTPNPQGVGRTTAVSVTPESLIKITGHKFNQNFPLGTFYHDNTRIGNIPGNFTNDADNTIIVRVPADANKVIVNGESETNLATVSKVKVYSNDDLNTIIKQSDNKWNLERNFSFTENKLFYFHLKAGEYTLRTECNSNSDTNQMGIYFYDMNNNPTAYFVPKNEESARHITLPKDCVQVRFYAGTTYGTSTGKTGTVANVSIAEGFENPPFEQPYTAVDVIARNQLNDHWKGKKIVWFGTSIPAGRTSANGNRIAYPNMIAKYLGANIYNEAIGSSGARFGAHSYATADDPKGLAGCWATETMLSLSGSTSEKQAIMDEWDTKWKNILPGASQVDITNRRELYLNSSWDVLLKKYLTGGEVGQCDLYVFDHGHNDIIVNNDSSELTDIPPIEPDRRYFIGAMDFLVTKILEDNPRARIMFIGHYESDRKEGIAEAQELLNSIWGFPLCKTWEEIGWSQNTITVNGVTKTITQIWMPDDLHPASDLTNKALEHYTEVVGSFIKNHP